MVHDKAVELFVDANLFRLTLITKVHLNLITNLLIVLFPLQPPSTLKDSAGIGIHYKNWSLKGV
jgi:hypothetical protein